MPLDTAAARFGYCPWYARCDRTCSGFSLRNLMTGCFFLLEKSRSEGFSSVFGCQLTLWWLGRRRREVVRAPQERVTRSLPLHLGVPQAHIAEKVRWPETCR